VAKAPLVTVVIPTYNRPTYLAGAVNSVLRQSYDNLEVIVADDASDARTRAVVESFSDERIVHRRADRNVGMLRNSLGAFRAARGEYIATVHDDDLWCPELVATLVRPLEADGSLVAAFSDHWVMDAHGRIDRAASDRFSRRWGRDRLPAGVLRPFHRAAVVTQSVPLAISGLLRKDAIDWGDFPDEVGAVYDVWLAYLASRDGKGAWYQPERLACYRLHDQSVTATRRMSNSRSSVYLRRRFLDDPRLAEHRPHLRRQYADACATLGISLVRAGKPAAARAPLRAAMRAGASPRAAAALLLAQLPGPVGATIAHRLRSPRRVGHHA
jgi:glycosyltransferase involved in cell wall biosynthesis